MFWVYQLIKFIEQPCEKGDFITRSLQKRKEPVLTPSRALGMVHFPEPLSTKQQQMSNLLFSPF